MVRYLLFTIGVILLSVVGGSTTQAQSTHNHAQCGVDLTEGQAIKDRMLENRRNKATLLAQFDNARGNDSTVYVPILFHIVNKSDGTGGESIKDILANLCKLNQDYAGINVEFYLAGPIRVINQDLLYTNSFATGMANFFMDLYRVDGMVNIFVGNQITGGQGGGTTLGYYTSGLDIIYAIQGSVHGNATTLTHELGHFFSLPHTFFGWENSKYGDIMANTTGRTPSITLSGRAVEVIIRSGGQENCQIAGDAFCDTDPNYLFGFYGSLYNNGCDYAATAHDPNGWLFRPDIIQSRPNRFQINEQDTAVVSLFLKNRSTKDFIYPKTLIVVETQYILGIDTILLWQDTIGDSDTTDIFVGQNNENDIIGTSATDLRKGFVHLNGHYFDVNVTCPTAPSLTFIAPPSRCIISQAGNHQVMMDSLRVTNTDAINPVVAGTNIVFTDIFYNRAGGIVSTTDRMYALPSTIAPLGSYTFAAAAIESNTTSIAGVKLNMNTYAPYKDTTGTTSENVMSYYDDACATQFSVEQGEAMKMDIASRAFATIYPKPSDLPLTDTVQLINPLDGAVSPHPLINLQWVAVTGATMYQVLIYELSSIGFPLLNGEKRDFMTTSTSAWVTLTPNKRFGWRVFPINAVSFCNFDDPTNGYIDLGSTEAKFEVKNWAVGVDQVQAEISSSRLFPNPSGMNQDVVLEISSTIFGDAQINILNSIGQEVMPAQTISLMKGDNVERLTTAGLAAGLYIVNIKTKNGIISHKMVIKD